MNNNIGFESNLAKFGIGLFETIKISNGVPIFLNDHMDRLYLSMNVLGIKNPKQKNELESDILSFCQGIDNKAIRVTLYDDGYNFSLRDIIYTNDMYVKGFDLCISQIKRGNSFLYRHKSTNYMENIYSKKHANSLGYDDAIFTNLNEDILECSMSNIFFIKDNILYTCSERMGVLPGIIRSKIIQICTEYDIEICMDNIKVENIHEFDFCFITNSLMDIMKVNTIENCKFDSCNNLFELLKEKLRMKCYEKCI